MSEADPTPSPFETLNGPRHWKIWAIAAAIVFVAGGGTWVGGQYKIGKLDNMRDRYAQPIMDYADVAARAIARRPVEADLLEGCKQAQIGSWLQTTDALTFEDPAAGNRVIVRLDPAKAALDLNGRELASCMSDEIENRQFDISSMTNTWALVLVIISLGLGAWSWFGWEAWRRKVKAPFAAAAATVEPDKPDGL